MLPTTSALLLSYLHDRCQSIYFGLPPSYTASEITLRLPCEEALWKAGSAEEWLSVFKTHSAHRSSSQSCLTGCVLSTTLASMVDPQFIPAPNLSPFSHFVLIHAILCDLFTACSESIILSRDDEDAPNQRMLAVQYALHNWLQSWAVSRSGHQQTTDEPSFVENGEIFLLALIPRGINHP